MKQFSTLLLLIAVAAVSCTDNSSKQSGEVISIAPEKIACYAGNSGKDTVTLSLATQDDRITGELYYKFYEKDQTRGTLSGQWRGDTLVADYIYTSEGMPSVRQVAFLQKGNTLIEGHGNMVEKNGKMVFADTASLIFADGFLLQKIKCHL